MELVIADIIDSQTAAFRNEGQEVYNRMDQAMQTGKPFTVSFAGLETCSTQFLNASLGKLYRTVPEADVDARLKITGIDPQDKILPEMIRRTREKAQNPDHYAELMEKTLSYA